MDDVEKMTDEEVIEAAKRASEDSVYYTSRVIRRLLGMIEMSDEEFISRVCKWIKQGA
jgi:hypothetical protein